MNPLVELHVHLDGSLRLGTMLDIAKEEGVTLPAEDEAGLYKALRCGTVRESLGDYLEAFAVTVSVMQTHDALYRIAHELMEDFAKDGILYAEIRFMPSLHTKQGLSLDEVMQAVIDGLHHGGVLFGVEWGLIICSMRHVTPHETSGLMDLAIMHHKSEPRVVAVDMAGDDALDALDHVIHYRRAIAAGLHVTIHAAEAGPPERIYEAKTKFGAERIGHGIRIQEDPHVLDVMIRMQTPLEVCPTSNVQIKQVASYETHPAKEYLRKGVCVTINTDNRMLADTTLRKEFAHVRKAWGLSNQDVHKLILNAIKSSFADIKTKHMLYKALMSQKA